MEKRHSHHQFITLSGSSGRPKYTTRHLAALDFLLHIPMTREAEIRKTGKANASKVQQMEDTDELLDQERIDEVEEESVDESANPSPVPPQTSNNLSVNPDLASAEELYVANMSEFAGKKLKGPSSQIIRYPGNIRYQLSRITDQSALCRQWEDQLLSKPSSPTLMMNRTTNDTTNSLLEGRMFFSRARSYPLMVCSVIKYDAGEEKARIEKMKAEDQKGLEVYELPHRDWRGFSYKPLFKQLQEERSGDYFFEQGYLYDPNSLDDPSMLYGSHRYVLQRSVQTGPILSSMILYVNKEELRESLNEQFHERHPNLPPSLTLSKIRNIKKKILVTCVKLEIELSTVALGMINFERLCLKGYVTKLNRKLSMAVAILLAYKFNENMCQRYHKTLEQLLEHFDQEWDLSRKQIFEAEFGAYVYLGFSLHVPYQHLYLMYTRLLTLINKSSRRYLGEDMQDVFMQDILCIEHTKQSQDQGDEDGSNKDEDEDDEQQKEVEEDKTGGNEKDKKSKETLVGSNVPFANDHSAKEETLDSSKTIDNKHPAEVTSLFSEGLASKNKTQIFSLPNLMFFEGEKRKSKEKDLKDKELKGSDHVEKEKENENEVSEEKAESILSPMPNFKSLTGSILKIPKRLSSSTPPLPDQKSTNPTPAVAALVKQGSSTSLSGMNLEEINEAKTSSFTCVDGKM